MAREMTKKKELHVHVQVSRSTSEVLCTAINLIITRAKQAFTCPLYCQSFMWEGGDIQDYFLELRTICKPDTISS